MIQIKGGVVNPAYIEVAHWVKGHPTEEGDNYSVFIYSEQYLVPTESALLVRFTSGKVNVYGGTNADIISDWLGIVASTIPESTKSVSEDS